MAWVGAVLRHWLLRRRWSRLGVGDRDRADPGAAREDLRHARAERDLRTLRPTLPVGTAASLVALASRPTPRSQKMEILTAERVAIVDSLSRCSTIMLGHAVALSLSRSTPSRFYRALPADLGH